QPPQPVSSSRSLTYDEDAVDPAADDDQISGREGLVVDFGDAAYRRWHAGRPEFSGDHDGGLLRVTGEALVNDHGIHRPVSVGRSMDQRSRVVGHVVLQLPGRPAVVASLRTFG